MSGIARYGSVRHRVRLTVVPIDAPNCDLDADGAVGRSDLQLILAEWGSTEAPRADIDGNGQIDVKDVQLTLRAWTDESAGPPQRRGCR